MHDKGLRQSFLGPCHMGIEAERLIEQARTKVADVLGGKAGFHRVHLRVGPRPTISPSAGVLSDLMDKGGPRPISSPLPSNMRRWARVYDWLETKGFTVTRLAG